MAIDRREIMDLFGALQPEAWCNRSQLTPTQRARRFWVPDVDDPGMVAFVQSVYKDAVKGDKSPIKARVEVQKAGVTKDECPEKSLDAAYSFWRSMLFGVNDVGLRANPTLTLIRPYIEFQMPVGTCCALCQSLSGHACPRSSPVVRAFYPPWHIGCELRIRDARKREGMESPSCFALPGTHLFNPIDFSLAWQLLAEVPEGWEKDIETVPCPLCAVGIVTASICRGVNTCPGCDGQFNAEM